MNSLVSRGSLFDDFFKDIAPGFYVRPLHGDGLPQPSQIKVDVKETDAGYTVQAELPGVPKEDIHVSVDGKTVNGECEQVEELLYRIVGEMQGSVSAEHGIGLHKKPFLNNSRTPAELAAMSAIKKALDPQGLMNPGKVFDL